MEAHVGTGELSDTAAGPSYSTGWAASADGTTIGYRQIGRGPGVLILHGTMSSGQNHVQLGEALADAFTVYLPDRRGRGLSGPSGRDFGIHKEVQDLEVLLTKTGARDVFGVSSGAIIALQAALTLPIRRVVAFEPPLFADASMATDVLARYDREMAQGNVAAALITAMRGAEMGPPIFKVMPRWLLERLTARYMASQDQRGSGQYVPMRALAPTLLHDFQLVAEMSGSQERLSAIRAEVLLLGGSKSPAFLQSALDRLQVILPRSRRVEMAGVGHAASWNKDIGGQPERVAQELRAFFV